MRQFAAMLVLLAGSAGCTSASPAPDEDDGVWRIVFDKGE